MTLSETKELLTIIKSNYQHFSLDNGIGDYWYSVLKDYDMEEVLTNILNHIESDNYKELPNPHQMVKGLNTYNEKQQKSKIYTNYQVSCSLCGKWMPLEYIEKHQQRCLDIEYLLSVSNKINKPTKRETLEQLTDEQLEKMCKKYPPNFANNIKMG